MLPFARAWIWASWLATGTDTSTDTGSESGTDTSADTSSTDTSSTDTSSTDTTDTGESTSWSTGDDCGGVCDDTPPVITSPSDGASVDSPFLVTFTEGSICYCDTCGCATISPDIAVLLVDGESYDGAISGTQIEVALPSGVHELMIVTEGGFSGSASEAITVTVVHGSEPASGGDEADVPSEPAGCGCSVAPGPSALLGLIWLALLVPLRRRV